MIADEGVESKVVSDWIGFVEDTPPITDGSIDSEEYSKLATVKNLLSLSKRVPVLLVLVVVVKTLEMISGFFIEKIESLTY